MRPIAVENGPAALAILRQAAAAGAPVLKLAVRILEEHGLAVVVASYGKAVLQC
jgi:hypothetical protein